jgi:ABC-type multidrug transport system fused ATPase/permease subunit
MSWVLKLCGRGYRPVEDVEAQQLQAQPQQPGLKLSDLQAVKTLLPYLWLDFGIKVRVVVSMLLLVFSKVFTILVPITFKNAIDTLSAVDATLGSAAIWIIMYGLLRFLTTGCSNFKDTVFNKVRSDAYFFSLLTLYFGWI